MRVEIFLDSANITEIRKWLRCGMVDGVTTNPSILLRDGVKNMEQTVRCIAELLEGRPISVEVTTNDLEEMLREALRFSRWAPNVAVKIPVVNAAGCPCLEVIRRLSDEKVRVNATALLSFNQVMLAAKAGAAYLSIFFGRVGDEGHDAAALISAAASWVERWGYGKILVGSLRGPCDVQAAARAGAHILTIPPAVLGKMADHHYSRATVHGFLQDAAKALAGTR